MEKQLLPKWHGPGFNEEELEKLMWLFSSMKSGFWLASPRLRELFLQIDRLPEDRREKITNEIALLIENF